MKILFICGSIEPGKDGVGDYTRRLSVELIKKGNQIFIIALNDRYSEKVFAGIQTEETCPIPILRLPFVCSYKCRFINFKKCIEEFQPDWVSLQYVPYAFNKRGMPFTILHFWYQLRKLDCKQTVTFHEIAIRFQWHPKTWLIGIAQRIIANILSSQALCSFTSIRLYQQYILLNKQKNILLPIGSNVSINNFSEIERETLRKKLNWENSIILTYFGTNPRHIGQSFEAICKLRQHGYDVKLLLIGALNSDWVKDAHAEIARLRLSKHVHFTGFLPDYEIFYYLKIADIYLGLFDQGLSFKSGTIAAAFAAGLPVVATQGDMTDLDWGIEDGEALLFYDHSVQHLVHQIEKLINNHRMREQMSQAAYTFYQKKLSWNVLAHNYISRLKSSILKTSK
ncbi:glycosyltransferase family 4 protein [Catalinimonas sp. 4WD22]|uniref:glycosyltransferase family 4 protein n=1 Tax=Catalinimonas locisalis TaxID=3133978 RepID=UPI0031012492